MKKYAFCLILLVYGMQCLAVIPTNPPAVNTVQVVVLKIDSMKNCNPAATLYSVPVRISGGDYIGAISIAIQFDSTMGQMLYTSNVHPELSQIGHFQSATTLVPGTPYKEFRAIWFSNGISSLSLPDNEVLFNLNFSMLADQFDLEFNTTYSSISDFDANPLTCQFINGLLKRDGCNNLSGDLIYNNSVQTPMTNVPISLWTGNQMMYETTTDQAGHFNFGTIDPGTYTLKTECPLPTGGINSVDALLVAKHFVGLEFLSGLALQAAETDQIPGINASDAFLILKYFSGFLTGFPGGAWKTYPETIEIQENSGNVNLTISALCTGDVNGTYQP